MRSSPARGPSAVPPRSTPLPPPAGAPTTHRASGAEPSPVIAVQVMQALVARELVAGFGLSERRAAGLLGIVPSSVSQYLSGKRLGPTISRYLRDEPALRIARNAAQRILTGGAGSRIVLEAAASLGERHTPADRGPTPDGYALLSAEQQRTVAAWWRKRIAGEQSAVAECMRLAQRSRDELTRAVFRQIASDSLRHAEIVASLAGHLDRGLASSVPTGITRADVERLIEQEHRAEATGAGDLGAELGGVMQILWESMEADERKHEVLLARLLEADLPDPRRGARSSRSPGRRT
jgi:uncharacterized protein